MTRLANYTPGSGTVLPGNASTLERTLDALEGDRLWGTRPDVAGTTGLKRAVPMLWDADACPLAWLPVLAWAFRLDFFDTAWPERYQRDMAKNARRLNELRGTVAGVKLMLELLGHANAQVIESPGVPRRGEGLLRGPGARQRTAATAWATFSIVLSNPVSNRQFTVLKTALDRVKRNCCWLIDINQPTTPLLRGLGHLRGQGKVRGTI